MDVLVSLNENELFFSWLLISCDGPMCVCEEGYVKGLGEVQKAANLRYAAMINSTRTKLRKRLKGFGSSYLTHTTLTTPPLVMCKYAPLF